MKKMQKPETHQTIDPNGLGGFEYPPGWDADKFDLKPGKYRDNVAVLCGKRVPAWRAKVGGATCKACAEIAKKAPETSSGRAK